MAVESAFVGAEGEHVRYCRRAAALGFGGGSLTAPSAPARRQLSADLGRIAPCRHRHFHGSEGGDRACENTARRMAGAGRACARSLCCDGPVRRSGVRDGNPPGRSLLDPGANERMPGGHYEANTLGNGNRGKHRRSGADGSLSAGGSPEGWAWWWRGWWWRGWWGKCRGRGRRWWRYLRRRQLSFGGRRQL